MIFIKSMIISLSALVIAAATNGKPVVTAITAENAEKILPKSLLLQHCAQSGYGAKDCNAQDFAGSAADLDGNGLPEFAIVNRKIEGDNKKLCTLYRDEKAKFALIQKDFPCEIEAKYKRTGGWLDIKGTIYHTICEPLSCEFSWTGSMYKKGVCTPKNTGACEAE